MKVKIIVMLYFIPLTLWASSLTLSPKDTVGFQVVDLENGRIVLEQNAKEYFLPASTAKIMTTLFALEKLGADYRFSTRLLMKGKVQKGTLQGDLYLKGSGDPLLLANDLFNLALELKAHGINQVDGHFYYDQSSLPSQTTITSCGQYETTDNPGVSALNVEFNRFKVYAEEAQQDDQKASLVTVPNIAHLQAKWSERPLAPETPYARTPGLKEEWLLDPQVKHRFPVHLPVKEVAPYTAEFFQQLAELAGVKLPNPSERQTPNSAKMLAEHKSIPLVEIVDLNLEYSNNLIAEILLLTAATKNKKVTTLKEASEELKKWLLQFSKDSSWAGGQLVCGSGLDENNQFSPAQLTKLLYLVKDKKYGDRFYRSILSVSGVKGWMYKRLDDPTYAYHAWAKTGTLDYSGGLAGYFYSKKNKAYAFTLLSSNLPLRQKMNEAKGEEKVKLMDQADNWTKSLRDQHDQMLKEWINKL